MSATSRARRRLIRDVREEMNIPNAGLIAAILLVSCRNSGIPGRIDPAKPYDLEATSVTHRPTKVRVGDKVQFYKIVSNTGPTDVPQCTYDVDLYVDSTLVSFDHATSGIFSGLDSKYGIAAGFYHWKPTSPGTYQIRFVVDEHNTLPETDEGNNVITFPIVVTP